MNLFLTLLKSECLNRRRIGSPGVFSADSPEFIPVGVNMRNNRRAYMNKLDNRLHKYFFPRRIIR